MSAVKHGLRFKSLSRQFNLKRNPAMLWPDFELIGGGKQ